MDIKYLAVVTSPGSQHVFRFTLPVVEEGIAFNHNVRLLFSLSLSSRMSDSTVTRR